LKYIPLGNYVGSHSRSSHCNIKIPLGFLDATGITLFKDILLGNSGGSHCDVKIPLGSQFFQMYHWENVKIPVRSHSHPNGILISRSHWGLSFFQIYHWEHVKIPVRSHLHPTEIVISQSDIKIPPGSWLDHTKSQWDPSNIFTGGLDQKLDMSDFQDNTGTSGRQELFMSEVQDKTGTPGRQI
jgi:hypothetical protein